MYSSHRLRFVCVLLVVGWSTLARAHGPLHEQIAAMTARIARDPKNARLYAQRGELEREHGHYETALQDFAQAEALEPRLETVKWSRTRLWVDVEDWPRARAALDQFLLSHRDHAAAFALRGKVCVKLGQFDAAVEDYSRALVLRPNPDYYLERAQAQAARGPSLVEAALRGLDEGLAILGPVITLQLAAIDLELRAGRTEGALGRLEAITDAAPRKEESLARRGDILLSAGRRDEARVAYEAALTALRTLPESRRRTPAGMKLDERLRGHITQLESLR